MSTIVASKAHVVLFAYGVWGHTRPLINFAARFIRYREVHITILVQKVVFELAKTELARSSEYADPKPSDLIRLVALENDGQLFVNTTGVEESFADLYIKLVAEESISCAVTGIKYDAMPHPVFVALDGFAGPPLQTVRKVSKKPVKVFAWHSGSVSAIFRLLGPEKYGGRKDPLGRIQKEVAEGKDAAQATFEAFTEINGSVVRAPGIPPMYDWEYLPQASPPPPVSFGQIFRNAFELFGSVDGAILASPEDFEPECIKGMSEWYAETGARKVYALGPLIAFGAHADEIEKKSSPKAAEIEQFLDSILKSHGKDSLVYISFGTFFWPTEPEKVWAFLDVLIEKSIPFIFNHSSPFASVPDEIVQKVKDYGLGLLSPWSPQQAVLAHSATGWLVSHCGHNSILEAISRDVPIICWPFSADQPINAIHMEENLKIAYELLEVRSGLGLQPLYRGKKPEGTLDAVRREVREVLAKAFGEDGKEKRENVKRLNAKISVAWDEGGTAKTSLEELVVAVGL